MSRLSVHIEGMDRLQAKIKQLPEKVKKRETLRLLRIVAKPTVAAARAQAPVGKRPHKRYSRRTGAVLGEYQPGNLRKSIGNITGKRGSAKINAVLYVGPRSKGRKYDGYYGAMVHYGTVDQRANPFMRRAFVQTQGGVTKEAGARMTRLIQKNIDRLSTA